MDPNTGLPPRVEVPKTDWFDPDKSANAPRKAGLLLLTAGRCCWPPQALRSMPSRRRRGRRTRCRVFAEPRPAGAYRGGDAGSARQGQDGDLQRQCARDAGRHRPALQVAAGILRVVSHMWMSVLGSRALDGSVYSSWSLAFGPSVPGL